MKSLSQYLNFEKQIRIPLQSRRQQYLKAMISYYYSGYFCFLEFLLKDDVITAYYRLGTVNSKSYVGKNLLRIKWKFELTVHFKHEILGKLQENIS